MKTTTKNITGNVVMPTLATPIKKAGTLIKDTVLGVAGLTFLFGYPIYYIGKRGVNTVKSTISSRTGDDNDSNEC